MSAAFDGLQNVIAGLGTQNDKRTYTTFGAVNVLQQSYLSAMYRSCWLAKKIINIPAEDLTREWLAIQFEGDAGESNQQRLSVLEKRLNIRNRVSDALKLARLFGGSILVIGVNDGKPLTEPLDHAAVKKNSFQYVHAIDRYRITTDGTIDNDISSSNFGLPVFYQIADTQLTIHHSRCIRFDGQKLPYIDFLSNGFWHDSELQHLNDTLLNYETLPAAIATMIFEANLDVIKSPGFAELITTKDGEQKALNRISLTNLMKSMNRALVLDAEETFEKKSNSFAGLSEIWRQFMLDVSGAANIPVTKLFGDSASGLNATGQGDLRNYYDNISAVQETELRPRLEKIYDIALRSEYGYLPDEMRLSFNPLWQIEPETQAAIDKTRAETDQIYLTNGVITEGVIAADLKERGTYKNMTDEDIDLASALSKPIK